ncbi:MAG: MBL fold metallo-hydrolase [Acetobacteraceae bacterium]|nr:MBL fold metallo-hydrolase [Acetobacteraceae bacterium]
MIRVRLLGTGPSQGVPSLGGPDEGGDWGRCDPGEPRNRRTRTAALIEGAAGFRLLVDTGPDLRAQLLAARVGRLDAVLWTHSHADHVMGLDELRQVNRFTGRALPVFGRADTLDELRSRFAYAFHPPTRGFYRPSLEPRAVAPGEVLELPGLPIRLLDQDHQVMRTLGLRIGRFAYTTDVVRFPEESLQGLEGIETWVVGCFQRAPHPVHAGIEEVLAWVARLKPRRTILTHMGNDLDHGWLRANLPEGVEPGFDGLQLTAGL